MILIRNGKFVLANGKPVLVTPGTVPGPTTMTLEEFSSFDNGYGTQPYVVIQHKAGALTARLPIALNFTGPIPTQPEVRIVRRTGGAQVMAWTALQDLNVSGSQVVGAFDAPLGADYYLQTRDGLNPNNASCKSVGTQVWGVGERIVLSGQSGMVTTLGAAGSYSDIVAGTGMQELDYLASGAYPASSFSTAGHHLPIGGNYGYSNGSNIVESSGGIYKVLRILAHALKAKYGFDVPVQIIPWAWNSNSLGMLSPGGANWDNFFEASGSTVGSVGFASARRWNPHNDYCGVCLDQGEGDQSNAAYVAALATFYRAHLAKVAPYGRTATDFFLSITSLGNYDPGGLPNVMNVRRQQYEFEAYAASQGWPRAGIGSSRIECKRAAGDPLHVDDSARGATKAVKRMIQSILFHLDCATFSGRGPQLGGYTRTGNVVTFDVTGNGGLALQTATGGAVKGCYANTAADANGFTGTNIPVTAALVNGNTQLAVTFPGGTTYPCAFAYMAGKIGDTVVDSEGYTAGCNPNITSPVYGTRPIPSGAAAGDLEPLGLPLLPTFTSIAIN